jgi:hypothetical protein
MSDLNSSKTTPQFTTAEYSGASGSDRCVACNQPITARYYRVNRKIACEGCTERWRSKMPQDSHAAYVRGLLFGIGAALVGMILYAGFTILTGFYIGYVSLAVGWMVGKAVMAGSKGIGGKRYQITAVVLTYAAVSIAAIPIAIAYQIKEKGANTAVHTNGQKTAADGQETQREAPSAAKEEPKSGLGAMLLQLLFIGLASPFLELQDPLHGVIGLIILFVGIRIAWKLAQGSGVADVQGPYDSASAASV